MMKFKCLVILGLFVSVQSASIYSKPIDIPVEVVYSEEIPYESHYIVPTQNVVGRKNLNEKIQLSATELRQLSELEDEHDHGYLNSLKNLDAKVQLSPEDLLQADKHLPLPDNPEISLDVKSNTVEENSNPNAAAAGANEEPNSANSENPVAPNKPDETVFASLGESSTNKVTSTEPPVPVSTTEENLPDPNVVLLIQLAQNVVSAGLNNIRENAGASEENDNKNPQISDEQWDRLNKTISSFFASLLDRVTLRGNKDNVLQDITDGFRKVTNNFVENLRNEGSNVTQPLQPALNVTQPNRPGQNIINLITAGFQRIQTSLNNIRNPSTTGSTVLGEKDQATTAAPGPIQNIVVQFGQAINQLNPFTQSPTAAPGSQGDEGSTPPNPFQNFANQVGQVINNLNPLNQLSTAAAQVSTVAPGAQNEGTTPSGPFQVVQDVFSQVGQAVNNIFTGSTVPPGSQNEEGTTPGGPFQQAFQNVVNVIGSLNPLNPTTSAPGAQNEEQTTQGPLQGLFSQVGQAISGLNPLNQASTGAPGNNPVQQGVQNVVNQISQAASTFNPLNQASTASPGNVLEGVQNAINQAGQAVTSLNPVVTPPSGSNIVEGVQNAINQAGQAVSPPSGNNVVEGVQNAINQVGQVVSTRAPTIQANPAESVETIQSIASEIISPEGSEEKAKDSFSEQEIMVAMD